VEPFAACFRSLQDASDALAQAQEVADYQSIGVRCREALLTFIEIAQSVMPWRGTENPPKKADLKAWSDHICSLALSGDTHKYRRSLFKTLLESAWEFANWLTHTKSSNWYDAEASISVAENAISLCISAVMRHVRGVPEHCPSCGSQRLSPERGYHTDFPEIEWERPTCDKCGWTGEPVPINPIDEPRGDEPAPPEGECIIPNYASTAVETPRRRNRIVPHPLPVSSTIAAAIGIGNLC